jgi:hypothetical protein
MSIEIIPVKKIAARREKLSERPDGPSTRRLLHCGFLQQSDEEHIGVISAVRPRNLRAWA